MRAKSVRKSPMSTAPTAAFTRSVASALVERAERQSGSRMAAYEMVAQTIGTSASWVRKFVTGRDEVKEPGWTVGWNILDQYNRICSRVEAEIEAERAKILALKDEIDAANSAVNRVVEGAARKAPHGT